MSNSRHIMIETPGNRSTTVRGETQEARATRTESVVATESRWILAWNALVFVALVTIFLLYLNNQGFRDLLPASPIGGLVPLVVPWAGALGGVAISLAGVAGHAGNWDKRYDLWHLARPLLGTILGSVGFLMVAVVLRSAGGNDVNSAGLGFVIAFVVGYREETFRSLLSKVVDTLIGPGQVKKDARFSVDVSTIAFKEPGVQYVRVTSTGKDPLELPDNWARITGRDASCFYSPTRSAELVQAGNATDIGVEYRPGECSDRNRLEPLDAKLVIDGGGTQAVVTLDVVT